MSRRRRGGPAGAAGQNLLTDNGVALLVSGTVRDDSVAVVQVLELLRCMSSISCFAACCWSIELGAMSVL